jgi:hypothetical protein
VATPSLGKRLPVNGRGRKQGRLEQRRCRRSDLLAPRENTFVGVVHVLSGSVTTGLSAIGRKMWSQNNVGITGGAELGDGFGFNPHQPVGATTVLLDQTGVHDAIQYLGSDLPAVLASGQLPPNLSERLRSRRMEELRAAYVILGDCAPLLPVTDPMAVSRFADGIVLIARAGTATRDQTQAAKAACAKAGAAIFGAVGNATPVTEGDQRAYYACYGEGGRQQVDAGLDLIVGNSNASHRVEAGRTARHRRPFGVPLVRIRVVSNFYAPKETVIGPLRPDSRRTASMAPPSSFSAAPRSSPGSRPQARLRPGRRRATDSCALPRSARLRPSHASHQPRSVLSYQRRVGKDGKVFTCTSSASWSAATCSASTTGRSPWSWSSSFAPPRPCFDDRGCSNDRPSRGPLPIHY